MVLIFSILIPAWTLEAHQATPEEIVSGLLSEDAQSKMLNDSAFYFADMCGKFAQTDQRALANSFQEDPRIRPNFEKFLQNTMYIGHLLLARG